MGNNRDNGALLQQTSIPAAIGAQPVASWEGKGTANAGGELSIRIVGPANF